MCLYVTLLPKVSRHERWLRSMEYAEIQRICDESEQRDLDVVVSEALVQYQQNLNQINNDMKMVFLDNAEAMTIKHLVDLIEETELLYEYAAQMESLLVMQLHKYETFVLGVSKKFMSFQLINCELESILQLYPTLAEIALLKTKIVIIAKYVIDTKSLVDKKISLFLLMSTYFAKLMKLMHLNDFNFIGSLRDEMLSIKNSFIVEIWSQYIIKASTENFNIDFEELGAVVSKLEINPNQLRKYLFKYLFNNSMNASQTAVYKLIDLFTKSDSYRMLVSPLRDKFLSSQSQHLKLLSIPKFSAELKKYSVDDQSILVLRYIKTIVTYRKQSILSKSEGWNFLKSESSQPDSLFESNLLPLIRSVITFTAKYKLDLYFLRNILGFFVTANIATFVDSRFVNEIFRNSSSYSSISYQRLRQYINAFLISESMSLTTDLSKLILEFYKYRLPLKKNSNISWKELLHVLIDVSNTLETSLSSFGLNTIQEVSICFTEYRVACDLAIDLMWKTASTLVIRKALKSSRKALSVWLSEILSIADWSSQDEYDETNAEHNLRCLELLATIKANIQKNSMNNTLAMVGIWFHSVQRFYECLLNVYLSKRELSLSARSHQLLDVKFIWKRLVELYGNLDSGQFKRSTDILSILSRKNTEEEMTMWLKNHQELRLTEAEKATIYYPLKNRNKIIE